MCILRPQSTEGRPLSVTGIACLELVREEHRRDAQRTQGVSRDGPGRRVHELLERGREFIICEERKRAQRGTLGVIYHGEAWLKLEETLDEVGR